jgi:hypothetical protein
VIFKCSECSHIFELQDPASGWEDDLNIDACPNCGMPSRKNSRQVKLVFYLLVLQLISAGYVATEGIFTFGNPVGFYAVVLLVTTLWLLFLGNRKGAPIILKRKESNATTEKELLNKQKQADA